MIKKMFLAIGLCSILASPAIATTNYPNDFPGGLTVRGMPILNSYPGSIWWVSSTGSDGNRGNFDQPFGTLDYAVGRCSANKGDIILVKPGYVGTVTSVDAINLDVAGIAIIGLGAGSDRPKINWGTSTGDIDVDAANITIKNFYFNGRGYGTVTAMIDVNSPNFTIEDCEFLMGSSTTTGIDVGTNGARCSNLVCKTSEIGSTEFIKLSGALDGFFAENIWVDGNFSTACLHNPTGNVVTNILVKNCFLKNDTTTKIPLRFTSACTGILSNNYYVCDTVKSGSVVPGICSSFNCYSNLNGSVTSGVLVPTTVSD